MTVIGFNFEKITAEKKTPVKGKISINNNVNITKVEDTKVVVTKDKQTALTFKFKYTTSYEPAIGSIELEGDVLWIDTAAKNKEIMANWKKDKTLPKDINLFILNQILTKGAIEALVLSQTINLPPPVQLPRAKEKV
ncbi:hypothetical protein C4573_00220 [Candidatus Woesearchaeota archaeon]|nr:MAG: hypothetical protein C4573_00220 [Candidatus Woesearchaeota archaeon]